MIDIMKLAVMQPYFLPYLGYFQLMDSVEHFMFFDDVQYIKKSWMNRNRLLNIEKNEPFFIRPEMVRPEYKALLPTVELTEDEEWKRKLTAQLNGYKNKAPFFRETLHLLHSVLEPKYKFLADFNIESSIQIAEWLGITGKFDRYTDYNFWFDEKPEMGTWGCEIANAIKASHYINSPGGESFIYPKVFDSYNIKLGFIQPELTPYNQNNLKFIPGLSIFDVLMFNGKENTRGIIKNYKIKWKN